MAGLGRVELDVQPPPRAEFWIVISKYIFLLYARYNKLRAVQMVTDKDVHVLLN